jgi:hypothetical protein
MKTQKNPIMRIIMLMFVLLMASQTTTLAQAAEDPGITTYIYIKVSGANRAEFIKRETTYWAEIARKAMADGNIVFWALAEKVGGYDLENSSNFLIMNRYKNIDAAGEVWSEKNIKAAFPNVTADKMETNSISTWTSQFYLHNEDWQEAAGAKGEDYKFVSMVYHDSSNPGSTIALERKHWGPFIKAAMDKKQTTQLAWGNAIILSPSGYNIHATTVSYDIYPSLKEALNPTWDPKVVFPNEGLAEINKLESSRGGAVYRIIKGVSPE